MESERLRDLESILKLSKLYPNVKLISLAGNHTLEVHFHEEHQKEMQTVFPHAAEMPPDDVMLFAATEDIDELLNQRKPE